MEETKEKKIQEQKQKKDGTLWFILLIGILVIFLGVTIFYCCKLRQELKNTTLESVDETRMLDKNVFIKVDLTSDEKIKINKKLFGLTCIDMMNEEKIKYNTNIIETDYQKYILMKIINKGSLEDTEQIIEKDGEMNVTYIEINDFQKKAKEYFGEKLNLNNLKEFLYAKNDKTYINFDMDGFAVNQVLKANSKEENKVTREYVLYVDIIDPYNMEDNKDAEYYMKEDFIEYNSNKVVKKLKITYQSNVENKDSYILKNIEYIK